MHIIPFSLAELWPLFSIFAGISLFIAGWRSYRTLRPRYVVPSIAFSFLGCILLMFSFDVVPFSFSQFILNWWPLLLVLAGLVLVLASLGTKSKPEDSKK
jgi:peptidoglycan/LPS O-acetylase OafA/YrhL